MKIPPTRTHPAVILLSIGQVIKQFFWIVVLIAVRGMQEGSADLGVFAFIAPTAIIAGIVQWMRLRYWVSADHLVIESGLLKRSHREIPLTRIQDLSFEHLRRRGGFVH